MSKFAARMHKVQHHRLVVGETLEPCGEDGLAAAAGGLSAELAALTADVPTLLLSASTGSGKSKWLPSWLAAQARTIVLTPARVDVKDMAAHATVSCSWQVGGECETGAANPRLRILSSGVASKKFLGGGLLHGVSFVVFDEVDVCSIDCSYAWLFEACVREARARSTPEQQLRVILTSATPGACALALVASGAARHFCYQGRRHHVETAQLNCASAADATASLTALAAEIWRLGDSSILACLGEKGVAIAVKQLQEVGVYAEGVHGKMDPLNIAAALTAKRQPRVLCATALVDRGITLSDIVWFLDNGLTRRTFRRAGISNSVDGLLGEKGSEQRRGRVGRVRAGAYVQAIFPNGKPVVDEPCPGSVVEAFAAGMTIRDVARLCSLSEEIMGEALALAKARFSGAEQCRSCYAALPLSLELAPAILAAKAEYWDVRWEVSALVALLESDACKAKTDVRLALNLMRGEQVPAESWSKHFFPQRVEYAKKLHGEICERQRVRYPSRMAEKDLLDAVALALLRTHLELGVRRGGVAYVAGSAVESAGPDGPVVLVGLRKLRWRCVQATFELPATPWVLAHARLAPPSRTVAVVGDSTLDGFKSAAFLTLRSLGLDLIYWDQTRGARETDLGAMCLRAPSHDVLLCFCNGNRTAREKDPTAGDIQAWMQEAARSISAAASRRSKAVAVFVGDAALSAGVPHPATYAALIPQLQEHLRRTGLPVIGDFGGERAPAMMPDALHWKASDIVPVQKLLAVVVEASKAPPPPLEATLAFWHWERMADGVHYPRCTLCDKWMDANHLNSRTHRQLIYGGDAEPPTVFDESLFHGRHFAACAAQRLSILEAEAAAGAASCSLPSFCCTKEADPPPPPPLPYGWSSACCSDTRIKYFYNEKGVAQWEHPAL